MEFGSPATSAGYLLIQWKNSLFRLAFSPGDNFCTPSGTKHGQLVNSAAKPCTFVHRGMRTSSYLVQENKAKQLLTSHYSSATKKLLLFPSSSEEVRMKV